MKAADEYPSLDDAGGLVLDPETHRYYFNGARVAGVTEILTGVGIVDARWFKEWHAQRGSAVHRAMELLVQGRLDWSSLDERIVGYVKSGERFLKLMGVAIGDPRSLTEHLVYSKAYRYAGKTDALLYLNGRDPADVDWKSGAEGAARYQTAAYVDPLKEELGLKRIARFGVQLDAAGKMPKVKEYTASRDHEVFLAAALIYNEFHLNRKDEQ